MRIIDAFLYLDEINLLKARLSLLSEVVDRFLIVESRYTFTGYEKNIRLPTALFTDEFFIPYRDKITVIANNRYIRKPSLSDVGFELSDYPVPMSELKAACKIKMHNSVWLNDCFQRELLYKALVEITDKDDLIILGDIDEIPEPDFYLNNCKSDIVYADMTEYRYSLQFKSPEYWTGSVKFKSALLAYFSINSLRFFEKRRLSGLTVSHEYSGWHFTSFGSVSAIKAKMNSWGHQELNTVGNSFLLRYRISRGFDIFGRSDVLTCAKTEGLPDIILHFLSRYSTYKYVQPTIFDMIFNRVTVFIGKLARRLSIT